MEFLGKGATFSGKGAQPGVLGHGGDIPARKRGSTAGQGYDGGELQFGGSKARTQARRSRGEARERKDWGCSCWQWIDCSSNLSASCFDELRSRLGRVKGREVRRGI
jgi:hypothetical protein